MKALLLVASSFLALSLSAQNLQMTPSEVRTFATQRAKRKVIAPSRLRGATATGTGRERVQPTTDILTPGPGACGYPQEYVNTSLRWCRGMGYEWMCGRGDFVARWFARLAKGETIDPALMAAEEGFDSPAINCTYDYHIERDNNAGNFAAINRNGRDYFAKLPETCSTSCDVHIVAMCVNEKIPSSYRIVPAAERCIDGGVEVPCP